MSNNENKKNNKLLYIIVVISVIAVIGIAYIIIGKNGIKNKKITAENYKEIVSEVGNKMKDKDELYYFTYSITYYMMKDGLASAFGAQEDESSMYVNIYGKTVNQLIKEGKKFMDENNMTIEQYKDKIQNLTNNVVE